MLDTIRYPLSGDAPLRTLAVGILLGTVGALVLPAVPVAGYYGRVLASSSAGRDDPPRFDRWGALFVQGLKTWCVVALYLFVGLLVLVVLVVAALVLGELGTGAGSAVGALAIVVGVVLLLGLFVLPTWFFFPAALVHVARTDSVAAAFDVRTIAGVATDRRYLKAWIAGVALVLFGSTVYVLTGGLGRLVAAEFVTAGPAGGLGLGIGGHVLGVTVNFYCQVVAFHLFGRGYGAAIGDLGGTDRESATMDEPEYEGWGSEARAWRERRRRERDERPR